MDLKGIEERNRKSGTSYRARVRRDGMELRADFTTPEEAVAWRARALRDLREGRTPPAPSRAVPLPAAPLASRSVVTLEDACRALVKGMAAGTIRTKKRTSYKSSVVEKYESMLRVHALDPEFGIGSLVLSEIEPADARDFINGLADRTSPGTAHKVLTALKVVGHQAVADRLISLNPFTAVTAPQSDEGEKPIRVITIDEADRIRDAARCLDARMGRSRAFPLTALAFATGLRSGELLALRYGPHSLDLDAGRIVVGPKGNLGRRRQDGVFPVIRPKSRASEREVEMTPSAVRILREHRFATGRPRDGAFVFSDERGNPLCGATAFYRDCWRRAVADASIPDPRPRLHDARHHWAIFMLRAGVQPQVIAKLGGWASVKILLDRYGKHALPDEHVGTGARLDEYLVSQRTG